MWRPHPKMLTQKKISHFRVALPLFQNESWVQPFIMKWVFLARSWSCKSNSFPYERLGTWTRFETEVKSNPEMACFVIIKHVRRGNITLNSNIRLTACKSKHICIDVVIISCSTEVSGSISSFEKKFKKPLRNFFDCANPHGVLLPLF